MRKRHGGTRRQVQRRVVKGEAGKFAAASDVRVLMKDGVEQQGVQIAVAGHRREHPDGNRRERALMFMRGRGRDGATAMEIGIAMMGMCHRARTMMEIAGLTMGVALVRAGEAVATRGNRFVLARYTKRAVPPAVRSRIRQRRGLCGWGDEITACGATAAVGC